MLAIPPNRPSTAPVGGIKGVSTDAMPFLFICSLCFHSHCGECGTVESNVPLGTHVDSPASRL